MLHIVGGAIFGAVLGAVGAVVVAKALGRPVTWKGVVAGMVGGLVGGAITAATLGAGGVVAASAGRAAVAYIAGGTGGGAATQLTDNALEGRPLDEGVPRAAALGAAGGAVSFGVSRVSVPILDRVLTGPRARLLVLGDARGMQPGGASAAPVAAPAGVLPAPARMATFGRPVAPVESPPALAPPSASPVELPPVAGIREALGEAAARVPSR